MARRRPDRHDELAPSIPHVPWSTFMPRFFSQWEQGEHVSIIGPTGLGKSTLLLAILPRRSYRVVFATKPKDSTLASLKKGEGYTIAKTWPPPANTSRVVLWPKISDVNMQHAQAATFRHCIHQVYRVGGWCVAADDTNYLTEDLRLERELKMLWKNGRSIGISLVCCIQRPAFVPTMAYDQPTHLFFFREGDEAALKRIGGIGWTNSRLIRDTVANLPVHSDARGRPAGGNLLYVNSRTAEMVTTRVELPGG